MKLVFYKIIVPYKLNIEPNRPAIMVPHIQQMLLSQMAYNGDTPDTSIYFGVLSVAPSIGRNLPFLTYIITTNMEWCQTNNIIPADLKNIIQNTPYDIAYKGTYQISNTYLGSSETIYGLGAGFEISSILDTATDFKSKVDNATLLHSHIVDSFLLNESTYLSSLYLMATSIYAQYFTSTNASSMQKILTDFKQYLKESCVDFKRFEEARAELLQQVQTTQQKIADNYDGVDTKLVDLRAECYAEIAKAKTEIISAIKANI